MLSQPSVRRSFKMGNRGRKTKISIKTEYIIILALSLLIIPFWWIFSWVGATVFHELFHILALKLSGCNIISVQIGLNGTIIETDFPDKRKEIFSALSGPLGSFLLILTAKWCPRLAICGLFQCAYNLIPIYPMDGGRAVRGILEKMFSVETSERIERSLENCVLGLILFLGLYAFFRLKLGLVPILFAIILIIKNKRGKSTCKDSVLGVK